MIIVLPAQSRIMSAVESVANVFVGILIAFACQLIIFTYYGINVPITTNMKMTAWFTGISLVRSFVLRRLFNRV